MRIFALFVMCTTAAALSWAALPAWASPAYAMAAGGASQQMATLGLGLDGRNACASTPDGNGAREQYLQCGAELTVLGSQPADPPAPGEPALLIPQNHVRIDDMIALAEPAVFMVIVALVALYAWRERRVLHRRQLVATVLLPALPLMALLGAAVYMNAIYAGPSHNEVSFVGKLIGAFALAALLTLILVAWVRFKRPPRQRTVLAIGAHPDDIEFGCGATMQRLRREGAATYGLVITSGERGHIREEGGMLRADEARAAARVMALCDIEIHDFPDTLLHEHKMEIRNVIEAALARWRPDIIFTHNGHDVHTDHRTIFEATREAARGAYTILCYENPNTPPGFQPGYFVDVSAYLDAKIEALACHRTQTGKAYAAGSIVRAMAGFRGTQARVHLAEGFEVIRVLEKARPE